MKSCTHWSPSCARATPRPAIVPPTKTASASPRLKPIISVLLLIDRARWPPLAPHLARGHRSSSAARKSRSPVAKSDDFCATRRPFASANRRAVRTSLRLFDSDGAPALTRDGGNTRRIERRQARRREWRKIDVLRGAVEDQLAQRLAGRRRVEHAPYAVPGRHIGAGGAR